MAPLVVEGDTLGQKHRNYNKIVNETTQELIPEIDYEEPDLDNLFKIDIACKNKNVDYIIKVLQCEDMLYVSRAITRSTWLITDPQYANIVNPNYLNDQLARNMMTKAFNKLLLHVRLNLKDEKRVDEFFKYYEEQDINVAFKWLCNCSLQLVVKIIRKHTYHIPEQLLKRLCEKSYTCLDVYMHNTRYFKNNVLAAAIFLLKTNMEKYLDIIERCSSDDVPKFGPKATKFIMKNCSGRVMNNFEKYSSIVHVPTLAKYINQEDIKDFITTNIKNEKLRSWFSCKKIKPFVNRLPVENRFGFIKEVFIDKKRISFPERVSFYLDYVVFEEYKSQNIYLWYAYAPFDTAFVNFQKLIHLESISSERASMLEMMVIYAGTNMKHVHTVLKYYRENHINEPTKYKINFVNLLVSNGNTHRFDKDTWGYLNDLFSSMGVYEESNRLFQNCVKSILLYNVVNDNSIPDSIQKKFLFDTFKMYQKNFSEEEKEKVFSYLYKFLSSQIDMSKINNKKEFNENIEIVTNILRLLVDWNKELQDFPIILYQIKEIVQLNQKNKWKEDISVLYNVQKSWRKLLFEHSIVLYPTQEVCINALKHGPELLETYQNEVETLCLNENKPMNQFLKKIRIYWSKTLANTYKDYFMLNKGQRNKHKAAIIGLCTLLQKNELLNLIQKYAPNESKIDSCQSDDVELNVRKHIASRMHVARPQPSPAAVLLYAKGDYLQYTLPSLNAILYNMNSIQTCDHLTKLLDLPVSLKTHVIRITFAKLKRDELKRLFDIWETNKNRQIRKAIFNQTLDLLCKENEPSAIRMIWELLSLFIDNLTSKDNKIIYSKLSKIENIPMSVRPQFWMKSYKFLSTLPPECNCDSLLRELLNSLYEMMHFLDIDFVAQIVLELFNKSLITKEKQMPFLALQFVTSAKTKEDLIARYNKVFAPILELASSTWNETQNFCVRYILNDVLLNQLPGHVVSKEKITLLIPTFTDILKMLRENLSLEEDYVIITTQMLSLDCLKILDNVLTTNEALATALLQSTNDDDSREHEPLHAEAAAELGKLWVYHLKGDTLTYFPSIYIHFAKAFKNTCEAFNFSLKNTVNALRAFLEYEDFIPGYLFVLETLPSYYFENDEIGLKTEMLNKISSHPSKEIKMHFYSIGQYDNI